MTPFDLYYEYRNLDVPLANFQVVYGIDVHEYRNYSYKDKENDFSCVASEEEFLSLKKEIKKYGVLINGENYKIEYPLRTKDERKKTPNAPVVWFEIVNTTDVYHAYIGKGSPAAVRTALRLAVAFGRIESTVSAMQQYCDKNIGLDCSGFAKWYFGGKFETIQKFKDTNKVLTKLEDVEIGTALIWKGMNHISLVDEILSTEKTAGGTIYSLECMVAEATGDQMLSDGPKDGLNYSRYVLLFTEQKPGTLPRNHVFDARRNYVKGQHGVYTPQVHLVNKPIICAS